MEKNVLTEFIPNPKDSSGSIFCLRLKLDGRLLEKKTFYLIENMQFWSEDSESPSNIFNRLY